MGSQCKIAPSGDTYYNHAKFNTVPYQLQNLAALHLPLLFLLDIVLEQCPFWSDLLLLGYLNISESAEWLQCWGENFIHWLSVLPLALPGLLYQVSRFLRAPWNTSSNATELFANTIACLRFSLICGFSIPSTLKCQLRYQTSRNSWICEQYLFITSNRKTITLLDPLLMLSADVKG